VTTPEAAGGTNSPPALQAPESIPLDQSRLANEPWQRQAARNEILGPWNDLAMSEGTIEDLLQAVVGELNRSGFGTMPRS
jgi:hypothetical protein